MIWLQGVIAVALLTGAIYGWFLLQRRFRGEDDDGGSGDESKRRRKSDNTENELEAFIAAYREGKVDPTMLANSGDSVVDERAAPAKFAPGLTVPGLAKTTSIKPGASGQPTAATNAATPSPAPAATPAAQVPVMQVQTTPIGAATLLRPEVKVAYLLFRTGLRDHHVFPNVRLGDLGYGVAVGTIDLLVCDPSFKYVAAIDVYGGEKPNDLPKAMFLGRAGIKHLLFYSKAMPKPPQLKDLIYGKSDI